MKLQETVCGFTVAACETLPELDARLWQIEHIQSGAKLVWLDRADDNMTFAIAFRTPPEDDTGVFHILEHSVLCGSDRYPAKEPFVELMKSSMSTFLNAMTFPDRTIYPISSRNPKDFVNLMRVYMDAVFHPFIYDRPEIFWQEGWHYAFDGGEPFYTGVVFNEMKGALASPEALLEREMLRQLFPDTCYRHNSGGDPRHIPELTYEKFLECHRRYYHPSNACIVLDGRLDIESMLGILDKEFLSGYTRHEELPPCPEQPAVRPDGVRLQYEAPEQAEDRGYLAWGWVLGDHGCREERLAVQALSDVLCSSNQAPLSRRVLSAGLAQDVSLSVVDGIRQPFALLELRGVDEGRAAEAEAVIREELARQAGGALDHEQLSATLANLEFQLRERNYGPTPRGVAFAMDMFSSWIYGGDPAANLEIGQLFVSLNRKLEEGWFEALLERVFLQGGHTARVQLVPSGTLGQEKQAEEAFRLQTAKAGWSAEQETLLHAQQERLASWQAAADTPEALASIPRLALSDISAEPEKFPIQVEKIGDIPLLRHDLVTGGICYVNLYFDMTDLSVEEISMASFFASLLGELDTHQYDTMTLQRLCRMYTGSIHFGIETFSRTNAPEDCRTCLCVSFSAVESKLEKAAELTAGFLLDTRFDDCETISELLRQDLLEIEQSIAANGSNYAVARISAGYSAEGAAQEYIAGVSYFHWLKTLERGFSTRARQLPEELRALARRIFTTGRLTVSVTGGETGAAALNDSLLARLPSSERRELECSIKPWGRRREGIIIPSDVSFAALGGSLLHCGAPYSGTTEVMGRVISLVHLWNTVRVQGGAYGTGMSQGRTGNACFHSYRDPNAARSLEYFRQTSDFLSSFCASGPDLTGFITGAISVSEPLLLPQQQGKVSDNFYLRGVTYEDRRRTRREMLSAGPDTLSALAEPLQELLQTGSVCVAGPRRQLEACGQQLDTLIIL